MLNMLSRTKLVTTCLLSLLLPISAAACFLCDTPSTPKDALQRYPIVFIGTVESKTNETVRFSVKEDLGGDVQHDVVMNQSGSSCDFKFEKGKTHLVYTSVDHKSLLAPAHKCSRTSEISSADADLKYLRSKKDAAHATREPRSGD